MEQRSVRAKRLPVRKGDAMRDQGAKNSRRKQRRKSPTAKLIPLFPADKDENPVNGFIANWSPSKGINAKTWNAIAPVTREIIVKVEPGSIEMARKYLRALARHIALRFIGDHQITDTRLLLNDQTLAQTLGGSGSNSLSDSSRATELALLYRIRQNLHPETYAKATSLKISKSPLAAPYTKEELAALLAWARQRSALRNIRIHGALLLSLACGLDGSEFPSVSGNDLYWTPWGLVLRAPGISASSNRKTRFVPVLAEYESELAKLAKIASAHPFVGLTEQMTPRDISREQPRTPGVPNFTAGKARANWTQSLLVNGASYVAMHHAGVSVAADHRLASLSREIPLPFQTYVENIRGGAAAFDSSAFSFLKEYEGPTQ
jgi:hypothetical protein